MSEIEVTVQSLLPPNEPQGRFRVSLSREATVENLLRRLCRDNRTSLKSDYVLHSTAHDILERKATLSEAGLEAGALLYWTTEGVQTRTAGCFRAGLLIALASLVIGAAGIIAVCIVQFKYGGQDFAVVFDAGSTHTSMLIFTWDHNKFHGTAVAVQFGDKCMAEGHGLTAFEKDPKSAGDSLQPCLDTARAAIPGGQHWRTPVYLGATAGMRLLRQLNSTACDAILEAVRAKFSESPFMFADPARSVRILTGSEEGIFSWITSNYVANAFKVVRPDIADNQAYTIVPSIGAMDLGGASTQITFVPEPGTLMPAAYSRQLQLFGHNYTVYTHSYLCYGVQEISRRILAYLTLEQPGGASLDHPCLPLGYDLTQSGPQIFASMCVPSAPPGLMANYTFVGSSNHKKCSLVLRQALFNFSSCSYSTCSFNNVYQPPVTGPFYAFSSFYYVSNFLNLSNSNSSSFQQQQFQLATEHLCSSSWAELQQVPASEQQTPSLMFYCLQANYINLLLSDGYNFTGSRWEDILFVGKVSGTCIGWSLGYVLDESSGYSSAPRMSSLTFALLVALFSGLVILAIVVLIDARRVRRSLNIRRRTQSQYGAI